MSSDNSRSIAIDQLEELGLSAYAARTFVALVSLGVGTAEDISDVADVPRTRVYDAAAELEDRGLVDVQESTPKRFWPISAETAGTQFTHEYVHRVEMLTEALDDIDTVERSSEQRGVWTVTGRQPITTRIVEFVDQADEEIVYMTVDELLSEEIIESLVAAADRGVTIRTAEMAPLTETTLEDCVPGAKPFDSLWNWGDTPAGRLLMVDQQQTLVSVLVDTADDETRDETAIWGAGATNGLVVVLKMMFTWQLDGSRG